jgi:hypothetical protein
MDLTELERNQQLGGSADRQIEGRSLAGVSGAAPPRISAEQHRHATAERIGTLAKAADHAAGDLNGSFPQTARFLHDTAAGFEHIADFLRDPKLDDITSLVGDVRRQQPAAIVAGLVLVGMGLSWFLRRSEAAPI